MSKQCGYPKREKVRFKPRDGACKAVVDAARALGANSSSRISGVGRVAKPAIDSDVAYADSEGFDFLPGCGDGCRGYRPVTSE